MDDHELLREFTAHRSERAFAALVEKHLPFVYATAVRLVRDGAAAEDVAQSVFIDLARKAWAVRPGTLPGWLYRATQRAAYMSIRTENRRRQRETTAMNLAEQNRDDSATWENLAPLLDEALGQLNRVEQDALLLRYFDGQSISETGRLLALSEAAAQKRVSRALEKMRAYFARKGVTASAALLATTLDAHAAAPPPAGLAGKITAPSLASAAASAGGAGIFYLLGRILFMSTKTKTTLAVATLAALILITIGGFWWYNQPAPAPEKVAAAVASPQSSPDAKTVAVQTPVSAPTMPTAPSPPKATPPTAVAQSETQPLTDPRVAQAKMELLPVIADILKHFEAGDVIGASMNHTYMPPEALAELNKMQADLPADKQAALASEQAANASSPVARQLIVEYQWLLDATPTLNEAGNEAIYTFDTVAEAKITAVTGKPPRKAPYNTIHFYKKDGQWYMEDPDDPDP